MPSFRLGSVRTRVGRFCAVGTYHGTISGFVSHVAINLEDNKLGDGEPTAVLHMGPPLQETSNFAVRVLGDAELTNDETSRIETWKAELDDERRPRSRARQYVAQPPVQWDELHAERPESGAVINQNTRTVRYRRFSCAGLVIDGYRSAGIHLLQLGSALPAVTLSALTQAYGAATDPDRRTEMGLPGPGPFQVVLPGYLIHALNRSAAAIRKEAYMAKKSDGVFS